MNFQIERLHLEGMKAQVKIDLDKKGSENKPETSSSDESLTNLKKPMPEFQVQVLDEEACNKEKLNLAVDDNLFGKIYNGAYNVVFGFLMTSVYLRYGKKDVLEKIQENSYFLNVGKLVTKYIFHVEDISLKIMHHSPVCLRSLEVL